MPFVGTNFSVLNSFTPATIILSSEVNANFTDMAANGLSAVLMRDGSSEMDGPLLAEDGLVSTPGIAFGSDEDTGLYRTGSNRFAVGLGGVLALEFANGGIVKNRRTLSAAGTVVGTDNNGIIEITTGTFSLAFTAAATLGSGFWCTIYNSGSGTVTLDPSGAELIDGAATIALSAGLSAIVFCTGTAFETVPHGVAGVPYVVGGTDVAVADGGTGASTAAAARTNLLVVPSRAYDDYTGTDAITSVIPFDDTKPQIGEGFEILSAEITLKLSDSRVRLRFQGFGQAFSSDDFCNWTAALFIAGTNSALSATVGPVDMTDENIGMTFPATLEFEHAPGSVGPHTYSIRVGPITGSKTLRMNSSDGARIFGGAATSTLVVEEIFI